MIKILEEKNKVLLEITDNQEKLINAQNTLIIELTNKINVLESASERDKQYAKDALIREYEILKLYEDTSKEFKMFMDNISSLLDV